MAYRQTTCSEQTSLFTQDTRIPVRQKGIPIYRVSLVREGKVEGTYGKIASSATASALLQTSLADVDREHFVILMRDRKKPSDWH